MSEPEIESIAISDQQVRSVLAEYGLAGEELEEAAARIVNVLVDAMDTSREDPAA